MAWGRTNGSSALQPDYGDDDDKDNVIDASDRFQDFSNAQDYSEPSSRRQYDDPNQSAYHHSPQRNDGFKTYYDRQNDTRNHLANAENTANNNPPPSKSRNPDNDHGRDIGAQERANNTSNFNYDHSRSPKNSDNKNTKQKGFASRHKKGIIGWTIGLAMGGGMFGIAGILAGPAQLLQVYHFFDDAYHTVHNLTVAFREGRISTSLARGLINSAESNIQYRIVNSRLNIVGRGVADSYRSKMAQNGFLADIDGAGRPIQGVSEIGLKKLTDNIGVPNDRRDWTPEIKNKIETAFSEKYNQKINLDDVNRLNRLEGDTFQRNGGGVDHDVGTAGRKVTIRNAGDADFVDFYDVEPSPQVGPLAKSRANKYLRIVSRDFGAGWLNAVIKSRYYSTMAGFVNSIFHPIQALQTKFNNSVYDRVASFVNRLRTSPEEARARYAATQKFDAENTKKRIESNPENLDNPSPETTKQLADADAKLAQANADIDAAQSEFKARTGKDMDSSVSATQGRGLIEKMKASANARGDAEAWAKADKMGKTMGKIGKTAGIVSFLVSIICLVKNIADKGMIDAFVKIVIPAIKLAGVLTNTASQMMAGKLSLEDIGAFTELYLYGENPIIEATGGISAEETADVHSLTKTGEGGKKTTETGPDIVVSGDATTGVTGSFTDSFWNACVVKSELDPAYNCSESEETGIDQKLFSAQDANAVTDVYTGLVGSLGAIGFGLDKSLDFICGDIGQWIVTGVSLVIAGVAAVFTGDWTGFAMALTSVAVNYIPMNADVKTGVGYAMSAMSMTSWSGAIMTTIQRGLGPTLDAFGWSDEMEELDTVSGSQSQLANSAGFGSFFSAQLTGMMDGGVILDEDQKREWAVEKNTYLAEQFDEKPWYAKLFDPTDYRSMIAVWGREAGIDPNPDGFMGQLGNVGKLFGVLPNLAFSKFFNSPYSQAMAASGAPTYDYGVDTVAVPLDVLTDMNDQNDGTKDIYNNMEKIDNLIQDGSYNSNYANYLKVCFNKQINTTVGDKYMAVSDAGYFANGMEGTGFQGATFYDMKAGGYNSEDCAGKYNGSDENYRRLAIYTGLDWSIVNSQGCYYGVDDETCEGMFDGSSGDDTTPIPDGDIQQLAQQILDSSNVNFADYSENPTSDKNDHSLSSLQMQDIASGGQANPSTRCTNNPNRNTPITPDPQILKFLLALSQKDSVIVNSLFGQCHGSGSDHYRGAAVDFGCPANALDPRWIDDIAKQYGVSRYGGEGCRGNTIGATTLNNHWHYSVD